MRDMKRFKEKVRQDKGDGKAKTTEKTPEI
jgi:hypothetical protein